LTGIRCIVLRFSLASTPDPAGRACRACQREAL
jgi:hypothetical protein